MNKNLLKMGTAIVASSMILTTGCFNNKMTEDEQIKFVNNINKMVCDAKDIREVEKELKSHIKLLNKKNSTQCINSLITSMYQANTNYLSKIRVLQTDLENVEISKKMDITIESNGNKIQGGMVGALLSELKENHLTLKKDGKVFYAIADMGYILENYSSYIEQDLQEYIKFRKIEDDKVILNTENNTFDLEEIASRIKIIEENKDKYQKSEYAKHWKNSHEYYYNILFSKNHTFFLDNENNFRDDVIKKMEEISVKYKDNQFGKDLNNIIKIIKVNKNYLNPDYNKAIDNILGERFSNEMIENKVTEKQTQKQSKETVKEITKGN